MLTLAACGTETERPDAADDPAPNAGTSADEPGADEPDVPETADEPSVDEEIPEVETGDLPDLTGKGLQAAQDAAQGVGFYHLTSHDSQGRDRMQVMDRNWQVCTQTPPAGEHPKDTQIDFGAVKLEEVPGG
jgi:hypothetical protein